MQYISILTSIKINCFLIELLKDEPVLMIPILVKIIQNRDKIGSQAKFVMHHFLRKYKKPTTTDMLTTAAGTTQYCFVKSMSLLA